MAAYTSAKQRYQQRFNALKQERNSWVEHWRELSEYIQPRRGRFLSTERNKGDKRNQKIINSTPTWSARVLAAGMMAGITSPARSWFRLTTPDPALAEATAVRDWLHVVEGRIRTALNRSNIYNGLHNVYADLGTFGVTAMHIEEDTDSIVRAYVFPVGSYALANSARLRIDSCYREVSMTVGQVVEQFGLKNCSPMVKSAYENNSLDAWVEVIHAIEPNRKQQKDTAGPKGMAFSSCWFETAGDDTTLLREGGYEEFPVMAPRWQVTGEDVYGSSPGMEAIGDAKALQLLEKRGAQAVDKIVNPPMRGPVSLMHQHASLLPGDITYVDSNSPSQMFAPAMEINPSALNAIELKIREHEGRVKTAYFADLWLMLANNTGSMTAREVSERHEEKMLQLGPVMERLQDELLDPLIDRVFGILLRNGMLPPPPEELQGVELRVEYVSTMAQAQKLLGISNIERLASFVGNLAAARPDVLDKVDFDQLVDDYSAALSVPPALVRSDDKVAEIRAARAKQQAQAQQAQQMQQTVEGAKVLSETDTSSNNALTTLLAHLGTPAGAAGIS